MKALATVYNNLLVPLDGSPLAERALPYAYRLAEGLGAQVLLLRVLTSSAAKSRASATQDDTEAAARAYLEGVVKTCGERVSCKVAVAVGSPAAAILDTVATSGCDLVVMSTHGRSGVTRWVLGSVADRVLHTAEVPTLLVRPAGRSSGSPALRSIVVPLDGSSLGEAALPVAQRLAAPLGLGLVLVQVVNRAYQYVGTEHNLTWRIPGGSLEHTAREYLAMLAGEVARAGITVDTLVLHGPPGERLSDLVRMTPGSLVVMSSHGRSGLSRWALGSIAEKVVRDSAAPVLVLRSQRPTLALVDHLRRVLVRPATPPASRKPRAS